MQRELLGDPLLQRPLRHVPEQQLALPGDDRLRERRVLLQLAADERERRRRRRRLQVRGDLLDVLGLPGLDALDDDQPPLGREEPERVAGGDRVGARQLGGRAELDGVGRETGAQPLDRAVDLRPVGSGDQVGRLQLVRHRPQA